MYYKGQKGVMKKWIMNLRDLGSSFAQILEALGSPHLYEDYICLHNATILKCNDLTPSFVGDAVLMNMLESK